jgi:hypothetical protein
MNKRFAEISLAVGGSHYPSINSHLQQKFGEAIVQHIAAKLNEEATLAFEQQQGHTWATLQALVIQILDDFDMELPPGDDWDAAAELQKIFDEFDMSGGLDDQPKV